jgi:hypothetical protein
MKKRRIPKRDPRDLPQVEREKRPRTPRNVIRRPLRLPPMERIQGVEE